MDGRKVGEWYYRYMKTLFICQANVGRSQAAMELFRAKGGQAASAGTNVDDPGATLSERPSAVTIIGIMRRDYGIDMLHNVRTQLTPDVAEGFDRLIVMAEKDTWPEWLRHDPRVTYWHIDDPKGQDEMTTRRIVREVEEHVLSLQQPENDAKDVE